jgi:hypothetical protein
MTVTYTTKPGEFARDYTAIVGQYRITLDKSARDYTPWCVFIYRFDGPTPVESQVIEVVMHTDADTLAGAKQIAEEFLASN